MPPAKTCGACGKPRACCLALWDGKHGVRVCDNCRKGGPAAALEGVTTHALDDSEKENLEPRKAPRTSVGSSPGCGRAQSSATVPLTPEPAPRAGPPAKEAPVLATPQQHWSLMPSRRRVTYDGRSLLDAAFEFDTPNFAQVLGSQPVSPRAASWRACHVSCALPCVTNRPGIIWHRVC
mmetsp:Transcript_49288/g.120176  ORF Transcript_49288/g.120176 Transcript_49288/m.120176 type:complete len:179 (+) Transcript_49288:733-1269(+)